MKFVQFTPEQSVRVLFDYAHNYARHELRIMDATGRCPKPLNGSLKVLEDLAALYGINFDDPENEELKDELIAEYRSVF